MHYDVRYGTATPHRYDGAFLFVVSHMRSYSSLLCHILGSHPEISGYSEAHQSYFGRNDLDRLARIVRENTGEATLGRLLLDKVLHNGREIAADILRRPDVRCVFLLRKPRDAMASIVNMAHKLRHTGDFSDPARVVVYYADRLARMEQYGAQVAGRGFFVESERLLDETTVVLARLEQWLGLSEPLSPEYRTYRYTGLPGHGDPSPHIRAGKVIGNDDERHADYVPIAIAADVLERGNAAYEHCRAALVLLR
ncbi:MAG TPA: sulfotransferase [Casimicrobiaceae bacterium]|nr:sulfotransferase [Casimicrobiaceae bacterium]